MIQKKGGVFLGSLFLVVLLLGVVSGQAQSEGNCNIVERASCIEDDDYIIFGLSDITNAHGQKHDATPKYPYVLCCNLPQTAASRPCPTGKESKVIGLSSITNAHAEIPHAVSPVYTTEVCFGDLRCKSGATNPNEAVYTDAILSLSGTTNAHIGNPGAYATKIWCNVYAGTYCGDSVAQGDNPGEDPNEAGTGGPLNDGYEDCDSTDPADNCIMTDAPYPCTCKLGYIPDVGERCKWAGSALAYWARNESTKDSRLITSEAEPYEVIVGRSTPLMVLKDPLTISPSDEFYFEVWERDVGADDPIRTGAEVIDGITDPSGGIAYADWTITQTDIDNAEKPFGEPGDEYEFYFKIYDKTSGELKGTGEELKSVVVESPVCGVINLCMDYSAPDSCENDAALCKVATLSVELNSDIKCDDEGITCECWWNETEGTCNSRWVASGIGSCKNSEGITEECTAENLFFKYSWTADWTWAEGNSYDYDPNGGKYIEDPEGTWHHDPDSLSKQCVGGSNVVPCPAQIQLPFFNIYTLIAVIVVIALIYYLMNLKKKKRKVSKKKK